MKILFSALHHGYFRNFESVIRDVSARGHQVHLVGDEPDDMGGQDLSERLARECPGVTWGLLPPLDRAEPWLDGARKLRLGLDYARTLEPRYAAYPKLRARAEERAPRLVRWVADRAPRLATTGLTWIERSLPVSPVLDAWLAERAPDVVILASLTYSRSRQMDVLKAARARRIAVAAAIMSWDHLSSKALLHLHPDLMLVWNDVQKQEAIEMHGTPAERVAITGAQCYDQWFSRAPTRSREVFCGELGLRADRPVILWVHSALSPTPVPPEPVLVVQWLEALRASADPVLREAGVIVRPHPERAHEWRGIDLARFEHVAFSGRNPIDAAAKADYFDALYHSKAVVGLVTSAFLEAVVVGRPVLTLTRPEYRMHQEEMLHFQYLRTVAGGVLQSAPDIEPHLDQLAGVLRQPDTRDVRNRRFLEAFIRPAGLDRMATPLFADALEQLHRRGTYGDPSLDRVSPRVRAAAAAIVIRANVIVGGHLLNDIREDTREQHRAGEQRRLAARQADKAGRLRAKARRQLLYRAWRAFKIARKETRRFVYRLFLLLVATRNRVRRTYRHWRFHTAVIVRRLVARKAERDPRPAPHEE